MPCKFYLANFLKHPNCTIILFIMRQNGYTLVSQPNLWSASKTVPDTCSAVVRESNSLFGILTTCTSFYIGLEEILLPAPNCHTFERRFLAFSTQRKALSSSLEKDLACKQKERCLDNQVVDYKNVVILNIWILPVQEYSSRKIHL